MGYVMFRRKGEEEGRVGAWVGAGEEADEKGGRKEMQNVCLSSSLSPHEFISRLHTARAAFPAARRTTMMMN